MNIEDLPNNLVISNLLGKSSMFEKWLGEQTKCAAWLDNWFPGDAGWMPSNSLMRMRQQSFQLIVA